jgi:Mor family transcriptional regulator
MGFRSQKLITEKHIPNEERNQQICRRYKTGERLEDIAYDYRISIQRASQIIQRWGQ